MDIKLSGTTLFKHSWEIAVAIALLSWPFSSHADNTYHAAMGMFGVCMIVLAPIALAKGALIRKTLGVLAGLSLVILGFGNAEIGVRLLGRRAVLVDPIFYGVLVVGAILMVISFLVCDERN
jgi:hypothetical protein